MSDWRPSSPSSASSNTGEPAALEQIRRVLAIPFKKTDTRLVPYLLRDELQALLDAPDPATREGIRDRAMLHLAICAGLRVSELTGLRTDDLDLASMSIRVLGKGRRERILPLWKTAAAALRAWLVVRGSVADARGVRQRPGRAAEPLGVCLSAEAACGGSRPTVPWPGHQARLAACVAAHLCHACPAGNAGYPQGVPVARPRQSGHHGDLHARRPHREARGDRGHRAAATPARRLPTAGQIDRPTEGRFVMVSDGRANPVVLRGEGRQLPITEYCP